MSYTTFNADTGNTNTSINVTGLINNRYYQFKVSAINSEGVGLPAETITVAPRIAPNAPTNVVVSAGNAQVIVSWTASNLNGGSAIAGYKVEYAVSPYSTWSTAVASTSSTSHTVTGLTNGTNYKFRVTGTNQFVTGPTSELSSAVSPTAFSATGGTITTYTSSGVNYKVHTFTSSGTLTVVSGYTNVDFLIVAGGGAGGYSLGGGGGGGGVISGTNYTLTENADLTITIGAGATGPTSSNNVNDGNDSQIQGTGINFKAHGGGGGGGYNGSTPGNSGGSGGGQGWNNARDPTSAKYYDTNGTLQDMPSSGQYTMSTSSGTVVVYGNKGGEHGGGYVPSAGGGAGQVGGGTDENNKNHQAHGGDGIQIAWTTPQALGVTGGNHGIADTVGFYWGGGGGANSHANTAGSGDGGKGGGGAGKRRFNTNPSWGIQGVARSGGYAQPSLSNVPSDGSGGDGGTNTGGGGGGGDYSTSPSYGGAGGSGIVVIRYVG